MATSCISARVFNSLASSPTPAICSYSDTWSDPLPPFELPIQGSFSPRQRSARLHESSVDEIIRSALSSQFDPISKYLRGTRFAFDFVQPRGAATETRIAVPAGSVVSIDDLLLSAGFEPDHAATPQNLELISALKALTEAAATLREAAEVIASAQTEAAATTETAWNVKSAKEQFSRVFENALTEPQHISRRDGAAVVVVDAETYSSLTATAGNDLLHAFHNPRLRGLHLPESEYPDPSRAEI